MRVRVCGCACACLRGCVCMWFPLINDIEKGRESNTSNVVLILLWE